MERACHKKTPYALSFLRPLLPSCPRFWIAMFHSHRSHKPILDAMQARSSPLHASKAAFCGEKRQQCMQHLTSKALLPHSGDSEGSADHDSGRDCALPMMMMGNSAAE